MYLQTKWVTQLREELCDHITEITDEMSFIVTTKMSHILLY